ncbi:hypothetical protein C2S51_036640 [Perilla frutescens var. frutescens]|nr:hypothetical protein C2S51_036640 [Perilla frutescens var. frutescens]
MASVYRIAAMSNLGLTHGSSLKQCAFLAAHQPDKLKLQSCARISEGRDSWCALEVFEWLKKENRVDKETMELMVSIMCTWVKKMIKERRNVEDVVDLLVDIDYVGLKTSFSMIEKVISLYWDAKEMEETVLFVKEVLRRGISGLDGDREGNKGGPTRYLAWKMTVKICCSISFLVNMQSKCVYNNCCVSPSPCS